MLSYFRVGINGELPNQLKFADNLQQRFAWYSRRIYLGNVVTSMWIVV